ncbi:hypothetical protein SeMB42_g04250 [Synchytrium endobioticum]|uniref:Myosin-binding domain-containing protein n=1 Tax=Synchytrium endobioticum TaxID=286115 RepID=A0A507D0E3_9FUNG|nr:hypothetical protein SeLEV6574_g06696 [Synchytrium endobioticum]TPX44640.1 hypothetical protein SeMB42_g04250 [Synchytrium endobioticum]
MAIEEFVVYDETPLAEYFRGLQELEHFMPSVTAKKNRASCWSCAWIQVKHLIIRIASAAPSSASVIDDCVAYLSTPNETLHSQLAYLEMLTNACIGVMIGLLAWPISLYFLHDIPLTHTSFIVLLVISLETVITKMFVIFDFHRLTLHFVVSVSRFEGAASRGIRLIQEAELVARGYRLSMPLAPISNIEKSFRASAKRFPRLRAMIRDSVIDLLKVLFEGTNRSESDDSIATLKELKEELYKVVVDLLSNGRFEETRQTKDVRVCKKRAELYALRIEREVERILTMKPGPDTASTNTMTLADRDSKPHSPFTRFLREASLVLDTAKSRLMLSHEYCNDDDLVLARQQFEMAGLELHELARKWEDASQMMPGRRDADVGDEQVVANAESSRSDTQVEEPTVFEGDASDVKARQGTRRVCKKASTQRASDSSRSEIHHQLQVVDELTQVISRRKQFIDDAS